MSKIVKGYAPLLTKGTALYMGLDVHKESWVVTVQTHDLIVINAVSIGARIDELLKLIADYRHCTISAVYEAGFSGFVLRDQLEANGVSCMVVAPSLIPRAVGSKVKTDKVDSRKLANLLAKQLLRSVRVPDMDERAAQEVVRTRNKLVRRRVQVQSFIKAFLMKYGLEAIDVNTIWGRSHIQWLESLKFENKNLDESYRALLEEYYHSDKQVKLATKRVKDLALSERYKDQVLLLKTMSGVGVLTAIELLVECGDLRLFENGRKLASYAGMTPSEHSSGEHERRGRITRCGKARVRGLITEAAWSLIRCKKTSDLAQSYRRLAEKIGGKKAIVAIARRMLVILRRMLVDNVPYQAVRKQDVKKRLVLKRVPAQSI